MRLKGVHLAMKTGMLAAEAAFEAIRAHDVSAAHLKRFDDLVNSSWVREELYSVRNVHQAFGAGLPVGLAYAGLSLLTGGWWVKDPLPGHAAQDRLQTIEQYYGRTLPFETVTSPLKPDRELTFDKLTNVHFSGTRHHEDQPSHLLVHTEVCHSICGEEYGHPCIRFCPANVYEIVPDDKGGRRLQINASNCVHCKTCDIMDPYQVITWIPPEGGGGPRYEGM